MDESNMDEAFIPFSAMLAKIAAFEGEIYDEESGVHSYINRFEIDTPVEINIVRDKNGKILLGVIPPLYRVDTTFEPSYHAIRFSADISES
jgi:hypothetical protein